MNEQALNFIKLLTSNDKKTLSQKTVKLMEETGELAKNILAYELASGSLHKFVHKDQVLENAIDTVLVALSIAYDLGYSDGDITDVMNKKSLYWSQLQQNELNINPEKIPHELHITISKVDDLDMFKATCVELGVKPIVLDLHTKNNASIEDIMTSSVIIGSTPSAFADMVLLCDELTASGYDVVRCKMEAPPWHPAAPSLVNKFKHKANCYFESHIEVYTDDDHTLDSLKAAMYGEDIHISKNFFKKSGSVATVMLTLRSYTDTVEQFKENVHGMRDRIKSLGFTLNGKEIVEYCVYDSNTEHDSAWVK